MPQLRSGVFAASLCALLGCHNTQTEGERAEREALARTVDAYRPAASPEATLPELTRTSSPADYVLHAAYRNRRVERLYHEWARSVEEITVAGALPDPRVGLIVEVGRMLDTFMPRAEQMVPGGGKLGFAATAQAHAAGAARRAFEQALGDVAAETWGAVLEAGLLEETIRIDEEILVVLDEFEELAAAQLRLGRVSQQDILRIQMEKDQLQNEIVSLRDSRSVLETRLRRLLGIAPEAEPPPLPVGLPAAIDALPEGDLFAELSTHRRELLGLAEEVREAEALIGLARASRVPDLMFGLGWNVASPWWLMPEVTATLPIYRDKIEAQIAAARAGRAAAVSAREEARLAAVVQLAEWTFRHRDALRRLRLLDDKLLPKAEAALDVARSGYPTGLVDLTSLLDAQRGLLAFRLARASALAERGMAWSQVVFAALTRRPDGIPFLAPDVESSR